MTLLIIITFLAISRRQCGYITDDSAIIMRILHTQSPKKRIARVAFSACPIDHEIETGGTNSHAFPVRNKLPLMTHQHRRLLRCLGRIQRGYARRNAVILDEQCAVLANLARSVRAVLETERDGGVTGAIDVRFIRLASNLTLGKLHHSSPYARLTTLMMQGKSKLAGRACILRGTDSAPLYQFRAKLTGKAGIGDSEVCLRVAQSAYSL